MAKIEVDNETGEIKKLAERFPSPQDQLFADLYLKFLEDSFRDEEEKDSKAEANSQSTSNQQDGKTNSSTQQDSSAPTDGADPQAKNQNKPTDAPNDSEDAILPSDKSPQTEIDIESKILKDLRTNDD